MNNHIQNLENMLYEIINNELQNMGGNIDEENPIKKRANNDFIDRLETLTNVDNKICNICLEEIKLGDECIRLPCKNEHYFHKNETEECGGILKWLNINNTCPCCREEFDYEEYRENEVDENEVDENEVDENEVDENENIDNIIENNRNILIGPQLVFRINNNSIMNMYNNIREEEDMQRAIELSLLEQ